MANEYTNDINIKNTISLRDILAELPSYVKVVFRGIENKASSRTRLGYAIDIKTFYNFLCSECPQFRGRSRSISPWMIFQGLRLKTSRNIWNI